MSIEATLATWRLTKEQVTSSEKLFLLSCANRAAEAHECWPSLSRLASDTGMDRKTLIKVRQSVIDKKLLEYTGHFQGRSGQIPVMRLTYVDQSVSEFTSTKNGTGSKNGTGTSTKNGTGDQSQNWDTESKRGNLKEETNTHTHSAIENNLYSDEEQLRKALFLRQQCIDDPKCQEAYNQLPKETRDEKTFAEIHEECVSHYATLLEPRMVSPQRLTGWIRREIRYQRIQQEMKTTKPRMNRIPEDRALQEKKIRERELKAQEEKRKEIQAARNFGKALEQEKSKIGFSEAIKKAEEEMKRLGMSARDYHSYVLNNAQRI